LHCHGRREKLRKLEAMLARDIKNYNPTNRGKNMKSK
jgi:hypothetical protein